MASVSTINSTDTNICSIEAPKKLNEWTSTKITQLVLYIFAALLVCAAIAACLLTPAPYSYLPASVAVPVLGIAQKAGQIKDYENPEKLKEYKRQAAAMSFQQLTEEFGVKNVLENGLLTLEQLKEKFNTQVQEMDFSSVLKAYSLDQLATFRIATPEHVALLRQLKEDEAQVWADYSATDRDSKARLQLHRKLNALEEQYNSFKKGI